MTNKDPETSAQYLWKNPRRANKMITESMQIMACALRHYECTQQIKKVDGEPYATPKSRMNHPVVQWVCQDKSHLAWLCLHCACLYSEYKKRGGNAFLNVSGNLKVVFNSLGYFDYSFNINFLNFAKCKEKNLDFTHLPVHEAYTKYLEYQEK